VTATRLVDTPRAASGDAEITVLLGASASGDLDATGDTTHAVTPGTRLGRYLVIEELGRGGMGVVLRAYDPKLQREVALKIVRTGALGASAQARLVREARAMARLSHPNVVAVYDVELQDVAGGVVMAMEYVPGTTLRTWLSSATRTPAQIVDAFVAAGRGLAAAHAEGLLHRDFKLDNVLVGNDGRVRVMDFGLARVTGSRASSDPADVVSTASAPAGGDDASAELTEAGFVMGTPPYMPPEQHEGGELDARADQYALCVALWFGLSGEFPFSQRGAALRRAKRDGPPPWPGKIAAPRHVVTALRRGLQPDPERRFPSVPALLHALGRDPRRGRRSMLAAGVLAVAALGAWGTERIDRARAIAACASEGERVHARVGQARLDAIGVAFEATAIAYAPDTWTRTADRVAGWTERWRATTNAVCVETELEATRPAVLAKASRACLDEQLDAVDALLEALSVPDATVVQRAASASASLPRPEACTDEAQLRLRPAAPEDPQLRDAAHELRARLYGAEADHTMGRYDAALVEAQAVLADAQALPWPPLVAEARLWTGHIHEAQGRYEEAATRFEDALYEAMAAGQDALAARASTALATTAGDHLARYDDGLRWGRLARVLLDRSGRSEDLGTAALLTSLGRVHHRRGEYDEALDLKRRAHQAEEVLLGPDHPRVAATLSGLGDVHYARGEYDDALRAHERAHAILVRTLGPEHPSVAAAVLNMGNVHYARKAHDVAVEHYERAQGIWERTLGPDHPHVAACLTTLGAVRQAEGKFDEATALHERARRIRAAAFGPESADVAASLTHLGNACYGRGEHDDAIRLWTQSLSITEKTLGPDHPNVAFAYNNLGAVRHAQGEYDAAVEPYTRALALREKALGEDHPDVAATLNNLALVQHERRAYPEAIAAFERALAIRERGKSPVDDIAASRFGLARTLWAAGIDRPRADELANAAREAWRARGAAGADALKMVDEWLATRK
jgi:eukaryotic-like serine/threonine-protein kinase